MTCTIEHVIAMLKERSRSWCKAGLDGDLYTMSEASALADECDAIICRIKDMVSGVCTLPVLDK
jgi:hypothetical protein